MMSLKKRLGRVSSLSLLSVLMMTLHAEARLPIVAFKNVTRNFMKGQEFNSPTFGEAALYSGVAYDSRLYGNIEPGVKEGQRFYIGDKGLDAISKLTKELLPSPTGALNVETTAADNFGKYVQSPKTVAALLNFAHKIRKGDKFNDTDISTYSNTLLKTCQGVDTKDHKNLKTKVNGILKSIRDSILEESNSPYPKYMTEQMINAFFCEKFSTQTDIWDLLRELDDDIVDKTNIPKTEDLLTREDLEVIAKKPVYDPDDIFALANAGVFGPVTPYKPGNLMSNGNTRSYDRKSDQYNRKKIFADCAEKAGIHVVNLGLFNPETQEFDLSHVRKDKKEGNPYFKNFEEFYTQQTPLLANAGDIDTRSLGARVTGDLNTEDDPVKIRYLKGTYELDPGYINFVRAYQKVLGLELKELLPGASLETQKEWLQESLTTLFKALNPTRNYDFDFSTLKKDQSDLSGALKITVKDKKNIDLFSFEFYTQVGIHSDIRNLKILAKQADTQDYSEALKTHATTLEEKTAEDVLWLLTPKVEKTLAPFYSFFTRPLSDNDSRIDALKKIPSYLEQGTLTPVLPQLLKNILNDVSWEDMDLLEKATQVVLQLAKIDSLHSILAQTVKGFHLSNTEDLQSPEFALLAKGITTLSTKNVSNLNGLESCDALQKLYLLECKDTGSLKVKNLMNLEFVYMFGYGKLSEVSFEGLPYLKEIFLELTDVRTFKGLEDLTMLEAFRFSGSQGAAIEEFSVENLTQVKRLNLQEMPIKAIKGLNTLSNVEEINLSYIKTLKEVSLENLYQLKHLNLECSNIQTIKGLNTLTNLETLSLNDAKYITSLEFTENMQHLKRLDLRNSGITRRSQIKGIEHLDESKIVWSGN